MATVPDGNGQHGGDGIHLIDLRFQGVDGVIAAYLVECGDALALIETGPTTTLSALEDGVAAAGFSLEDLTHVMVTHIHLDHSGAAGVLVRDRPGIEVLVHPVGAPHLIDPAKLVSSAGRIYGEDMERLWGEIAGVPEVQVTTFGDGEAFTIGDRSFRAAFTRGHASHHVVIHDERSGTLFTGDTGGVRVPGTSYVAAPIPPPELDPEAWLVSLEVIRGFAPRHLALTHFGFYADVDAHLDQIAPRLEQLVALGEAAGEILQDTGAMAARLDEFQRARLGAEASDEVIRRLNLANPDLLGAMGLQRYLRKRNEAHQANV